MWNELSVLVKHSYTPSHNENVNNMTTKYFSWLGLLKSLLHVFIKNVIGEKMTKAKH